MQNYNKLLLASELLVESAKIYRSAISDIDFAKSILLAGAVTGIIEPLLDENLNENKTISSQKQFAKLAAEIAGVNLEDLSEKNRTREISKFLRVSKFTYNTLKHAGKKDVKAVDDLNFKADLNEEAYWVIHHAITDFIKVPFSRYAINELLSDEFRTLMCSPWLE